MAANRKYPDWAREAIGDLCNDQRKTAGEAARLLAAGYNGHEPLTIGEDYIRSLARDDRRKRVPPLDERPLGEAIDTLARRTLTVVATEITRLQAKNGPLDADQILKLARTIKELHPLAQAKTQGPTDDGPDKPTPAWAQGILGTPEDPNPGATPNQPRPLTDRSIAAVHAA